MHDEWSLRQAEGAEPGVLPGSVRTLTTASAQKTSAAPMISSMMVGTL